ncbi:MAG: A/G-specific adenine glycosylase [Chloroflexota bacterium]
MPAAATVVPVPRDRDASALVPLAARTAILAWYDARGRSLPFRASRDPYEILVSETMAQQTQIARAAEKWTGFVRTFPTFAALAAAAPADVLRAWRGLGYNRRAVNLRRAAIAVVEEHGGRLPAEPDELERLPGVGPYTARAVAAIAFRRPVGAVDTNVRRVLSRVAGADGTMPPRELQRLADAVVPADRAADWTHAVMDVGATFCRSRRPACAECPVKPWCRFSAASVATQPGPRPRNIARSTAFPTTSRWLRGRILERLRDAHRDAWTVFDEPIGAHDEVAVAAALVALERDGLVERDVAAPLRARLPLR